MELNKKIILDLCGGTGAWSEPYRKAGYTVKLFTLPEHDVLEWWKDAYICNVIGNTYGILAAPPCTMFSFARTNAKKPRDLEEGMRVVRACLDIIWASMEIIQDTRKKTLPLKFWALENPAGMLKYFLGKPAFEFNPYDFGGQYQKHTYLWGWFNEPMPVLKTYKSSNLIIQKKFDMLASREIAPEMFGKLSRQERRAITPSGFAEAFFRANQ